MSKKDSAQAATPTDQEPKQKHDPSLNIFQRMIEVQKLATTVHKTALVKMSETDKGYKATTHDEVAATLHLPLAECGVFMLPDIVKYSITSFDKVNQWGKNVTWYRTDMDILVKWINVDKPDEFITSTGASFALDTSDKSFAKAYSLALKIVLLKVHLLESRDGEENRPYDEHHGGEKAGKGEANQNKNQGQNQQNSKPAPKPITPKVEKPIVSPSETVLPDWGGSNKGKMLKDIDTPTLEKIRDHLKEKMQATPKPQNIAEIAHVYAQIKAVLTLSTPPPPDTPPENVNPATGEFLPENENQLFPPDESQGPGSDVDNYAIPKGTHEELELISGIPLKKISEKELREALKIVDREMKKWPTAGLNPSAGFEVRTRITEFFRSMGV